MKEEVVYQIKVKDMYVHEPKVVLLKEADKYRKFMGFYIGKKPVDKNEYKFLGTSFSDEPTNLSLDEELLNVVVNGLAEKHEDIKVFQMVPYQIYPEVDEDVEVELTELEESES